MCFSKNEQRANSLAQAVLNPTAHSLGQGGLIITLINFPVTGICSSNEPVWDTYNTLYLIFVHDIYVLRRVVTGENTSP